MYTTEAAWNGRPLPYTYPMKDVLLIGLACVVAVAVGAWLYLDGSGSHAISGIGPVPVTVLAEGQESGNLTERKNYRLRTADELGELSRLMYGPGGPSWTGVDFAREEVLAVFDGTHSSGGYAVEVVSVEDTAATRKVTLRRVEPGESCVTTSAMTSPFILVRLPATPLPLERIELAETRECE